MNKIKNKKLFVLWAVVVFVLLHVVTFISYLPLIIATLTNEDRGGYANQEVIQIICATIGFVISIIATSLLLSSLVSFSVKSYEKYLMKIIIHSYFIAFLLEVIIFFEETEGGGDEIGLLPSTATWSTVLHQITHYANFTFFEIVLSIILISHPFFIFLVLKWLTKLKIRKGELAG